MDGKDESVPSHPPPEYANASTWTAEQQTQELKRRMGFVKMVLAKPFSFSPRPTDVIIATPPKSGTTWVSHICHQIRCKGAEPNFENQVPEVTTLLEASHVINVDPDTMIQPAEPRIYLTHRPYNEVPKGGKLICCFREQKDVLYSLYRFMDSRLLLKGRVSLPVFLDLSVKESLTAGNLHNLITWWEHRHDKNVLFLCFEDLKENHEDCVRRIAKFIGVDCDEETIARVVRTTTHAEMVRHHAKFDDHNLIVVMAKLIGEDIPSELTGRVRKDGGKSGDGEKLPLEEQQRIDQEWRDIVTAKLGFGDLKEMRAAWKKEMDEALN